jgi:UDP-glucose 4-epimerase
MRLGMLPGGEGNAQPIAPGALRGKIVLVTGARGFLGRRLCALLDREGARLIRLGRLRSSAADGPLGPGGTGTWDLTGDIRDPGIWTKLPEAPDFIFHLAAQTSAGAAEEDPAQDLEVNVAPLLRLLETCRHKAWRPGILFAGSATQVGVTQHWPVDESAADRPVTIYDRHKLIAESYLEHYARRGWARGATLRLPNVYGPGPVSGGRDRGILNAMMRRALRGEDLTLYGAGHQVRDYLFVDDVVDAFLAAAVHLEKVSGEHFVLGSGVGHTLAEAFALVADRAALHTGLRVALKTTAPPPGSSPIDDRSFVADSSRFRGRTGWCARVALAEGVDRTLRSLAAELVEASAGGPARDE